MSRIGVNSSLQSDEAPIGFLMWEVMDSNHRRRTPADLQSAPFGHSGNFPSSLPRSTVHPPPSLASAFRADGGIRTPDQLITNQLLWPTELHRQNRPFWIAKVGIKNLSTKLSGINFLFFYSSQRTGTDRPGFRSEIGCKFRKSFEYHNSFAEKYHRFRHRNRTIGSERIRGIGPSGTRRRSPIDICMEKCTVNTGNPALTESPPSCMTEGFRETYRRSGADHL